MKENEVLEAIEKKQKEGRSCIIFEYMGGKCVKKNIEDLGNLKNAMQKNGALVFNYGTSRAFYLEWSLIKKIWGLVE